MLISVVDCGGGSLQSDPRRSSDAERRTEKDAVRHGAVHQLALEPHTDNSLRVTWHRHASWHPKGLPSTLSTKQMPSDRLLRHASAAARTLGAEDITAHNPMLPGRMKRSYRKLDAFRRTQQLVARHRATGPTIALPSLTLPLLAVETTRTKTK